jgi:hypothetical protein
MYRCARGIFWRKCSFDDCTVSTSQKQKRFREHFRPARYIYSSNKPNLDANFNVRYSVILHGLFQFADGYRRSGRLAVLAVFMFTINIYLGTVPIPPPQDAPERWSITTISITVGLARSFAICLVGCLAVHVFPARVRKVVKHLLLRCCHLGSCHHSSRWMSEETVKLATNRQKWLHCF